MANPQSIDAHLRIAHSIQEQIMVSDFSEQQRRILDFILRLSWGCGKKVAYIPQQNYFEIVGVRRQHIKSHLDWLVRSGVIFRQDSFYQLNKDFDHWRVTRSRTYAPEKLAQLIKINLNDAADIPEELDTRSNDPVTKNVTPVTKNVTGRTEVATKNVARPVTKYVTEKLQNTLLSGNEKRYCSEAEPASPKENINKYIKENNNYINIDTGEEVSEEEDHHQEAQTIWNKVLAEIRPEVSAANYRTWLEKTVGTGYHHSDFIVAVPTSIIAEYLQSNMRSLLGKTLIQVSQKRFTISFIVVEHDTS